LWGFFAFAQGGVRRDTFNLIRGCCCWFSWGGDIGGIFGWGICCLINIGHAVQTGITAVVRIGNTPLLCLGWLLLLLLLLLLFLQSLELHLLLLQIYLLRLD